MRGQWGLILSLIAAVVIAIFAVINVDAVRVNYLFGTAEWPLILVILGSVLMGALIAGLIGMVRFYQLQSEVRRLKKAINAEQSKVSNYEEKVTSSEVETVPEEIEEKKE